MWFIIVFACAAIYFMIGILACTLEEDFTVALILGWPAVIWILLIVTLHKVYIWINKKILGGE